MIFSPFSQRINASKLLTRPGGMISLLLRVLFSFNIIKQEKREKKDWYNMKITSSSSSLNTAHLSMFDGFETSVYIQVFGLFILCNSLFLFPQ